MICELLALAEISHELNDMDKGETFSVFCDVNASRCCDLKFDVWDHVFGKGAARAMWSSSSYPSWLIEMGWAVRDLAETMEFHFVKRTTQRAGKGL